MKLTAGLLAFGLIVVPAAASARGHGGGHHSHGGHHSYSGHHSHGGHHSSGGYHGAGATEFRTSTCKSAACFRKHPGGTYVHPITPRKPH